MVIYSKEYLVSDAVLPRINIPFLYLRQSHVKVYLNTVLYTFYAFDEINFDGKYVIEADLVFVTGLEPTTNDILKIELDIDLSTDGDAISGDPDRKLENTIDYLYQVMQWKNANEHIEPAVQTYFYRTLASISDGDTLYEDQYIRIDMYNKSINTLNIVKKSGDIRLLRRGSPLVYDHIQPLNTILNTIAFTHTGAQAWHLEFDHAVNTFDHQSFKILMVWRASTDLFFVVHRPYE